MSAYDDYLDPDRAGLFDECEDNSIVEQAFADYEGPYDLYRSVYKYTACGPSLGFTVRFESEPEDIEDLGREVTKSYYCDDLRKLGTWADMREHGMLVLSIGASSIVEGVDWDVPYRDVDVDADQLALKQSEDEELHETLLRLFYAIVEGVDTEAAAIWNDTHGCETCADHWQRELGIKGGENEFGYVTVWAECPDCGGHGIII